MDDPHRELLTTLSAEALDYHGKAKVIYCEGGEWPDLEVWSRTWRKKLEPIYYACSKKAKPPAPPHTVPVNICVGSTCLRPPAPAPAHQITPIDVCALSRSAMDKHNEDVKAGHTAGAEYWHGQATGYGVLCAAGRSKESPAPAAKSPINVCTQIARAKKIHEDYMNLPEDPITGDHPWHSHWISVYDKTLEAMECPVNPPTPPPASDIAWFAGFLDGEGNIYIKQSHPGRGVAGYELRLTITNTHIPTLERISKVWGMGKVFIRKQRIGRKPIADWIATYNVALKILEVTVPYLVTKQAQAKIAIAFQKRLQRQGKQRGVIYGQYLFKQDAQFCELLKRAKIEDVDAEFEINRILQEKEFPIPPTPPQMFGWVGGKKQLAKTIVALIPPHKTYVEAFCGAAAVFWKKEPSQVEVLNDLDKDLIRFYRHIGDIDRCDIKDISRDCDTLRNKQGKQEPCEFLSNVLCSFGDMRRTRTLNKGKEAGGGYHRCYANAPSFHKYLDQYKERLKGVKLHNEDWLTVVRRYDAKDTFFYLDPPYHGTSRDYNHNGTELPRLAEVLPKLKGKWLLSYDDHPEVRAAFKGYSIIGVTSNYTVQSGSNSKKGKQVLIANYDLKKPPAPPPYKFMSLSEISKYEPEMRRLKVSEVARSPRGFLTAYKRAGSSGSLSESWRKERDGFIARHLAQYNENPTYRRQLALIAWAYMPAKNPPAPAPLNICIHSS